jgi:glycosyltransferase involved in cell wall biosynthesis
MAPARPSITAVVCTYNRYAVLPKAIDSLVAQSLPPAQFNIMVVDNSPDPERAAVFGRRFKGIRNLTYLVETTPGLSNARNRAARDCETPLIAYIDDDAVADAGWLREVAGAFEDGGPAVQIVGGRVDPLWGAPRPTWLHDSLLGHLSVVNWGGVRRPAGPGEWFAGTNISFRTKAILEHGGFAANLGRIGSGASLLSNEEMHLLERIRGSGGRMVYAPDALVEHLVDPKRLTRAWFRKRSAWQAVSDFTMDPERHAREAGSQWPATVAYFNALAPHQRTIRGLIVDTDDPELFRWQLGAVYMLTLMSLAGFEGVALE